MNRPALITRAYDAQIEVYDGERSVAAVITTEAIDRMKEVVAATGLDLRQYKKNPIVLWAHNQDPAVPQLPIGRGAETQLTKDKRGIVSKTVFDDHEFAEAVFQSYAKGILKGFSIGFRPDWEQASRPNPKELKARPDLSEARMIYRKSELLEYSAVPVPANHEALALAVSKGIAMPDILRKSIEYAIEHPEPEPEPEPPPLPPCRTFEEVQEAMAKQFLARLKPDKEAERIVKERMYYLSGRV